MTSTAELTGEFVKRMREKYGSPVYVIDEASFTENYRNLESAFRKVYPRYRIAYSYKTNYTPYICGKVHELGGMAEVVSDFEYDLAKRLGYAGRDIVYNGPWKQEGWKELLEDKGILNIDNPQEAERIIAYAQNHPEKDYQAGIRVNMDIGQGFISRFGMDPNTEAFGRLIRDIRDTNNLKLAGIHCHISQARGIRYWKARTDTMLSLADRLFGGGAPDYIDLGSGMYGDMESELREQFGDDVPSYEDYAATVAGTVAEHYRHLEDEKKPWLYTEPGATLVSRYMWLIATIVSYKEVQGRKIAGLDCSFYNAGETVRYKKLPFKVFSSSTDYAGGDFVGYTCLEDDLLLNDYAGSFAIGDPVVFGNAGGYSVVFKPPFILPDIPMVVLQQDGETRLVKRAQTFGEMLCCYEMPEIQDAGTKE